MHSAMRCHVSVLGTLGLTSRADAMASCTLASTKASELLLYAAQAFTVSFLSRRYAGGGFDSLCSRRSLRTVYAVRQGRELHLHTRQAIIDSLRHTAC